MKNWFLLIAFVTAMFGCSPNNVTVNKELEKFFTENKVTGTFGIFNNGSGQFTVYNLKRFRDSAYLPASTFKIVNSLIGLETGKITDENMVISWDGKVRGNTAWNRDLTMAEAFKVSAVPYYQEVARRIGRDTMLQYLDTIGYGVRENKPAINQIDSFWLNNAIKITADEQVGLVKKLYFDQLPFQKRSMRIVKDVMVQERNANYTLAYKTGLGFTESGEALGWVVGWIVENSHPHFFALNITGAHNAEMIAVRMKILKQILKQLGYLEGKM